MPRLLGGVFCSLVLFFFVYAFATMRTIQSTIETLTKQTARQEITERAFIHMPLEAKNVVVYDATHNVVIYGRGAMAPRPLASISKIMTTLVARNFLAETTPITITAKDRTEERDATLRNGDTWKTSDLMQYSLVSSSNDGVTALCNAVNRMTQDSSPDKNCISFMNQYATNHGLTSMLFQNASGLDQKNGNPSNLGSALDVAKLLTNAYNTYPTIFEATRTPSVTFKATKYIYTATNTNEDVNKISNLLAGKTGYTDVAGGNLAILYAPNPNTHIVIVVLGSSHDGRFDDMLTLVSRTNIYLKALGYLQ
jgi:D-alanyl-D-alanine carboxypeptidase (penicillin-binding protein 5/6)